MTGPRILLVVGGGIAAYKACELVRLIVKAGGEVVCVLTEGGVQFVTPMSLAALSGNQVHTSLWNLKDEVEIGHIQLSRQADLVVVCPATADLLAKMAAGIADDLATTLVLATDKPVLAVPAMNVRMWLHPATQRNAEMLRQAGVHVMHPDDGEMACGEYGPGRLPEPEAVWREACALLDLDPGETAPRRTDDHLVALEPEDEEGGGEAASARGRLAGILASIIPRSTPQRTSHEDETWDEADLGEMPQMPEPVASAGPVLAVKGAAKSAPPTDPDAINHTVDPGHGLPEPFDPLAGQPDFVEEDEHRPLFGRHVLVTAGPTHEPIDPVRYIANRSSGKQGFAIAAAAAAAGARVTLVAGPVELATPVGVDRIDVESATDMVAAVKAALPADAAIMVAAVADWRVRDYAADKIKKRGSAPPALLLTENPDILATLAGSPDRPRLVVGFAAETENVVENARRKRKVKGIDWIVANDVTTVQGTFGGEDNTVHLISEGKVEDWKPMSKQAVARELVERVASHLAAATNGERDD